MILDVEMVAVKKNNVSFSSIFIWAWTIAQTWIIVQVSVHVLFQNLRLLMHVLSQEWFRRCVNLQVFLRLGLLNIQLVLEVCEVHLLLHLSGIH